jgi:hypothetical protein
MTNIYIDVGIMKSGTKFREYILYPAIKDINLYNFPFSKNNPIFYDYENAEKVVLVDESLSGWIYRPEHDAIKERNYAVKNIKNFFPDANIIICTRDKKTLVNSAYKQYVFSGGINSFDTWYGRLDERVFDFKDYINDLEDSFNRVLVLDFKLLKNDIQSFAKEMCNFMEVDVPYFENRRLNVSLSDRQTEIWRLLNHLWKTHENIRGIPVYHYFRKLVELIGVKGR